MRRLISFVLAFTMILGCFATTASATEPTYEESKKVTGIQRLYDANEAGTSYTITSQAGQPNKADTVKVPVLKNGAVVVEGIKTSTPSINFTFGHKAYYPLVNASGNAVTDAAYVELASPITFVPVTTGAGANDLTFGTDYEIGFEKQTDCEGEERYFLVFDVKANSTKTNGHINGTFTINFKAGNTYKLTAKKRVFDPKSVVAVNASPMMTKAPQGFIATRDYSGVAGTSAPTYFHYGKTTYFTLQNNVNTTCDDDKYVNLSGITTSWTEGGEYVEKVELVKEYYNNPPTKQKYYLAITMKEGDANATEKLAGTVTLQHNNDNYGYNSGSNVCKITFKVNHDVQGKPAGGGSGDEPQNPAVEADRVTAVQASPMMTKAPQGYIASRGYGGISGMAAPTYFQYGNTTYFTLKDGTDTTVTDERYVNLEESGITADWTAGGEYVESVKLVKEFYNTALTTDKYYLAITMKDEASFPDYAQLTGTVTLTHNDPDFGYKGTDGKITVNFDKEIWRANGAKEPYRVPKAVDGITISSGTDGAANAVLLTSTLPVMVEGPNGDVGFYGYDGSEGAVTYLKRGIPAYFPIVDKNGDPVTEEKFVKNSLSKAATKWAISGNNVDTAEVTVNIVKKENSAGIEQYFFAVTVADNGTDLNSELYYAFGWLDDNFNWSETTAGGYARTVIRKQVQPAGEVDYNRVIGVNETLPMVMTPEGYVATRDWDRLPTTPKPNYLAFGDTFYYTLKDAEDTIVTDEKYIDGYTVDLSGLTGAEYIEDVKIVKARYGSGSSEKYYLAVTATGDASLGNGTLSGAIKITNNTPSVGFNAPDYTISLTLNMPVGNAVEGKVKTISNIVQSMYQNQVFYQTDSGEASTKVNKVTYGNTAYFQLLNESGGDVTDFNYVDGIEIIHTFDPALIEDISIVSERYMDEVIDTRYYVAVKFVEQTDTTVDTLLEGTITLKKGDGAGEYDVVNGSVTSAAISLTVVNYEPVVVGKPTEGDSRRVHHFMRLGTDKLAIWPLVENDDGRIDRYENGYGRGQVTSSETVIPYGGSVYYMLADCEGRPVTDPDFAEDIKIKKAEFDNYGNFVDEIKIVKARLADGIPVNGTYSKDLICYFLKISFVMREQVYRYPMVGDITLYKRGDEGIATNDNELDLFIDIRFGHLDATQDHNQWNREFFGDRVLADTPTRYKFADPSFEEGGAYNAVGSDPHDVIYFTEDQDAYITVSTKNQGSILLYVDTAGVEYLWDVYGPHNELKFYMGNNAKFLHMGVITIEQPEDGWCLYRVKGGMLYEADDAVFDEKAKAWNIRTRELGQFCLSDKPLDLNLQYTTEIDPYRFIAKGTSIHKPTDMLDEYILNQERLGNLDKTLEHYVLSSFTVKKGVSEWIGKNLKAPVNLNSKFGWTVSIDPKDIPEKLSNDFTLTPFVTDTANAVLVDLVDYLGENKAEYPLTVTVTRKKLQDLKAVAVYGKTVTGEYVHLGDADAADGSVSFETVKGIDSYVLTNLRRDAVSLKQYKGDNI